MKERKFKLIIWIMFSLLSILLLYLIYDTIDQKDSLLLDEKEFSGDIGTSGKKLLNGYLGVFFRFKYLSNINWLIIPLLVWYFVTHRKRVSWQKGLVFVWAIAVLFINIKGYYNSRYQLTLFPFNGTIILLLLWEFLKGKKQAIKILVFSIVTFLCVFNFVHYFDQYKFFWEVRVTLKNPHFPVRLIDYFNNLNRQGDAAKTLVINQPIFYYHTNNVGIDYRHPKAWQFIEQLNKREGNRTQLFHILKESLDSSYILLTYSEKSIYKHTVLTEFLEYECEQVVSDNGWHLYKLNNRSLRAKLSFPGFKNIKLWNPKRDKRRKLAPYLYVQGKRGRFKYHVTRESREKILSISNLRSDDENLRILQIGYDKSRMKRLKIDLSRYRYIHFLVKVKISEELLNNNNYIFIQDFYGEWERERCYFSSPYWRTYLLSKKIRENSTKIMLGFRFNPSSSKEKLLIKDIKLYVSNRPL
jgi:hypothetical protein